MTNQQIPDNMFQKFLIKFCRLHPDAVIPTKAHENDLGWDLHNIEDVTISAQDRKLIRTGISIGFPENAGAIVKDRSGVATKQGLFVHAGVIDPGYTGEIKILMYNSTKDDVTIKKGAKIAQFILMPVFMTSDVQIVGNLDGTQRGDAGFGSTGE